jgi:hypothetical protein
MNWKLILALSMFALAMGVGTVFVIPSKVEPAFWLVIFLICAYLIAEARDNRQFQHGLVLGLVNSVWVTAAHILFFSQYMASHPAEAEMTRSMPLPDSPRLMMALVGPIIGLVSGVVIGLLALLASRFVKPEPASFKAR